MLNIREGLTLYFYNDYVDMRKSIAGLSAIVLNELQLKPDDGSVYIFNNRNRDKLKIIFYDRNGFVLYYKLLHRKKFSAIKSSGLRYQRLTAEQLDWLLAGLDLEIQVKFPEINYRYFY